MGVAACQLRGYSAGFNFQPGFDLPVRTGCALNRFCTGQGPCAANLHKWGLASSDSVNVGWHRQCHIQ